MSIEAYGVMSDARRETFANDRPVVQTRRLLSSRTEEWLSPRRSACAQQYQRCDCGSYDFRSHFCLARRWKFADPSPVAENAARAPESLTARRNVKLMDRSGSAGFNPQWQWDAGLGVRQRQLEALGPPARHKKSRLTLDRFHAAAHAFTWLGLLRLNMVRYPRQCRSVREIRPATAEWSRAPQGKRPAKSPSFRSPFPHQGPTEAASHLR